MGHWDAGWQRGAGGNLSRLPGEGDVCGKNRT